MKFVLALCALFFAVQAQASTVRYEFEVKVTEEKFYASRAWEPGDASNFPGSSSLQTVTYENNPYGFHYLYSAIRDGGWHSSFIELEKLNIPNVNVAIVKDCSIGGFRCGNLEGYFKNDYFSSTSYDGQFSAFMVNGGFVSYSHDGYFTCGEDMMCGLYAATLAVRIEKTPLPAGGVLLFSGLALAGFIRRAAS